ncbi:hypothetical protein D9M69_715890 [compost metagenome]
MFLPSTGERVALVTTPTWARPTCTQSPWAAGSLPSSSSPTRRRCGWALRRSRASLPMKSACLVFSGTQKPMPASKGSVWSQNS